MTQVSLSHQPRVYIDDNLIEYNITGALDFKGNNQLNTLSIKISNTDL